jgi:formylglycine-generating enzyme required for sulfatase activity
MGKNWAIVVGINDYEHIPKRKQLQYAVRDAEQIGKFLQSQADFEVLLCTDASEPLRNLPTHPRRNNLRRLLKEGIPQQAQRADNFWFFFSGHGSLGRERQDYLLTSDFVPGDIEETAVSVDFVICRLMDFQPQNIVLVLDMCRDGVTDDSKGINELGTQTLEQAKHQGITTIFSCGRGEESYEISEIQQGSFTYALLNGLKSCPTPRDLDKYLAHNVPQINRKYGKRSQHPLISLEPASKYDLPLLYGGSSQNIFSTSPETQKRIGLFDASHSEMNESELENKLKQKRVEAKNLKQTAKYELEMQKIETELKKVEAKSLQQQAIYDFEMEMQKASLQGFLSVLQPNKILKNKEAKLVVPGESNFEFESVILDTQGQKVNQYRKHVQRYVEDIDGISLEIIAIPGGTYLMGSSESKPSMNEQPVHSVTIQPFWISKYTITKSQWKSVASLPTVNHALKKLPSRSGSADHPVVQVSWYEAVEFCERLSRKTGHIYRLPSESEWEFSCRAGTSTPFHFGETLTSDFANYDGSILYRSEKKSIHQGKLLKVGSFPFANLFGLFDMHGNVWEWCLDHWHESYDEAPIDGSAWVEFGNNLNRSRRIIRGGSWRNEPYLCRSAYRTSNNADDTACNNIGFRVVREIGTYTQEKP